jgi:thioredoxin reductase
VGGQAGTTSLIRNYLGFPRGISGKELAARAAEQAQIFGTELVYAQPATGLRADGDDRVLTLADGSRVTLLVRGPSLAEAMSAYLRGELERTGNITVLTRTEVTAVHGTGRLEAVTVVDRATGTPRTLAAPALFILIGAEPHTGWLAGAVQRDQRGFVLTGLDLGRGASPPPAWPPLLLETSLPGVFAAGDVRHGSVKRVASAVGEGAIAVQLIHQYLAEPLPASPRAARSR